MVFKYSILAVVAFVISCSPAAPKRHLTEFPNWTSKEQPQSYDRENLWEAINGAAEIHLAYGFEELKVYQYDQPGSTLSLEIYNQGDALNAFGIFLSERPPQSEWMDGNIPAVFVKPYDCSLVKNRFYVKLTALEGELTRQLCNDIREHLSLALPGKDGLPEELAKLPTSGRIRGSEGFAKKSYLGLTELTNCIYAKYADDNLEEPVQLFSLLKTTSEATTDQIWDRLKSNWSLVQVVGIQTLVREIPYRGKVYLTKTGDGIYGVADAKNAKIAENWLGKLAGKP